MKLGELIAPVSKQEFFEKYWEARMLHAPAMKNNPDLLGLFALSQLDHFLGHSPHVTVKMTSNDEGGAEGTSVIGAGPDSLGLVYNGFSRGKTLIVDGMQRLWPPINALCRDLSLDIGMGTHVNLYVTPPGRSGFGCHWDGHDVLVVQTHGSKRWVIYPGAALLPHPSSPGAVCNPDSDRCQAITMRPGDVLYIPRGMPHKASAECDEASVHLTIGLTAATWEDLVVTALRSRCEATPALRKSLPLGWRSDASALSGGLNEIRAMLAGLLAEDSVDVARERLATESVRSASIAPDGHFAQIAHIGRIRLQTLVEKRTDNLLVSRDGDDAVLHFPGNFLAGPSKLFWAFDFIAAAGPFRVGDIPGWYGDEERLNLVKRLVSLGLLRVVKTAAQQAPDQLPLAQAKLTDPVPHVIKRGRLRP